MIVKNDVVLPKCGRCAMCGQPGRDLWFVFVGDYAGWTCPACISQLQDSQQRRFTVSGEMTEPSE